MIEGENRTLKHFRLLYPLKWSRDSVVGTVTGYRLDDREVGA
jgi:hypothetical protein